tara:strand:- start:3111 stop:3296 length:186 start_codon:yes stop_codon:yes gene_type:complete
MKVGDLVQINCDNRLLDDNIGVVVLNTHDENNCPPYGLCVMIDGMVYGFLPEEVSAIDESG